MALIAASAVRSCLGDGRDTFAALLAGTSGVGPLRAADPDQVNVGCAYQITATAAALRASSWLTECVRGALSQADLPATARPVPVLVGTGLRELAAVECWAGGTARPRLAELHFTDALRAVSPSLGPVLTLGNACSAAGHALGLAQDLVETGSAAAVVVAGTDSVTTSMLAMIGRVSPHRTDQVRPFDANRTGVLLGEGAAAVVVVPDGTLARPLAELRGTGISCDAVHETAPDQDGIGRAMREALDRARCRPADVELVLAHGTGTELNDRVESAALRQVLLAGHATPWVTAVKGALGHTSGASALMSLDVAIRTMDTGWVPPVVGLRDPAPESAGLRLVRGAAVHSAPRTAQIDAFGFGGVNAVTIIGAPR